MRPNCAVVTLFLLNSKSDRAGIAARYEKVRKGNKEDIAWITLARSQVSSEQFNEENEVLEG